MNENSPLNQALVSMLRPLARLLLRNGVSYKAFAELAKSVFVEVAREEFRIPGRKQSDSRVSVITGLSRKEVKRVQSVPENNGEATLRLFNRAARVIYGWVNDPDFVDGQGEPVRLKMEDDQAAIDFVSLVRRYSGDAPPRAVLDELDRVRAVERHDDGHLSLRTKTYAPPADAAPDKLQFLGDAAAAMIESVDRHWKDSQTPHFHGISVREVPESSLEAFRRAGAEEGKQAVDKLAACLPSEKSDSSGRSRRAGAVVFTFEQ
ncbi:DUF6502 family protein [Gammaproteobacteria bacterium AB-CW1]|uniref:DUF6502 family protein n=1 Tax=Natronospira elongata TaxID=3110268 RepID=A0AAP6JCY1_9GAMM|nr:DUF6502 family protein [Gammaproteobacteria bacterium AB-CW1]